jgi:protein-disulfide isomerase
MMAFDAAYHNNATLERIRLDIDDGKALGVQGTPTFFVEGDQVRARSYEDLRKAIEDALQQ